MGQRGVCGLALRRQEFYGENDNSNTSIPKPSSRSWGKRGHGHCPRRPGVHGLRRQGGRGYILYFVDDTYFKAIRKEYQEKRPVVCLAAFDNREELVRDSMGREESRIVGEVDTVLRNWVVGELDGFVHRLSIGRYLFLTDGAHIEEAKSRRFQVLDEVREIKSANNKMSATPLAWAGERRIWRRANAGPGRRWTWPWDAAATRWQ